MSLSDPRTPTPAPTPLAWRNTTGVTSIGSPIPWQRLKVRVEIEMIDDRDGNIDIFISNIFIQLKKTRGLQGGI